MSKQDRDNALWAIGVTVAVFAGMIGIVWFVNEVIR